MSKNREKPFKRFKRFKLHTYSTKKIHFNRKHFSKASQLKLIFLSFQGAIISHNASARVIRSNQSLVLQKVNRNSSGNYSCSAINAEGETVSNQMPLRVKCECLVISFIFSIFEFRKITYTCPCSVQGEKIVESSFTPSFPLQAMSTPTP